MARLTIHGARGSYPVSGDRFRRYGGSTTSISLETSSGVLVIDAGTGFGSLGDILNSRSTLPPVTLLLTHVHLDHLVGLPSFKPLLRADCCLTIMGDTAVLGDWKAALRQLVRPPLWPVGWNAFPASVAFEELPRKVFERHGIAIRRAPIRHPQGALGYRLEADGRAIVIGTDREHGDPVLDRQFLEFCAGADVLLHDAQYTPEELPARRGWGHSTWRQAAELAREAKVKQLVLVSHDPVRSDEEIDRITALAREAFPNTIAGREGLVVDADAPLPAAAPSAMSEGPDAPLVFRYQLTAPDGAMQTFTVPLDRSTLQLIQPPRDSYPAWTQLAFHKCPNCPLDEARSPRCPAAVSLIDVVDAFRASQSIEEVVVDVETPDRRYSKRCSLQEVVSSLIGLHMAASGCPVMAKLRPMVRSHLPFSTLEDTRYRALSMYLLAQYFIARRGGMADWDMDRLVALYEDVLKVNTHFFKRLLSLGLEDASLNAIVRLDSFAGTIAFTVDEHILDELEQLFRAYLEPQT
jgi:phosphoribosyl 1,2-cyclic phosphodiesterase